MRESEKAERMSDQTKAATIWRTEPCGRCRHPKGQHEAWASQGEGACRVKGKAYACSDCEVCRAGNGRSEP